MIQERRKFERVLMPSSAKAFVTTRDGKKIGDLGVLGRGGFQVTTKEKFKSGEAYNLMIVDETEGINRGVWGVVRMVTPDAVGFEFESLEADAAVEIGVIIGKYYSAQSSEKQGD